MARVMTGVALVLALVYAFISDKLGDVYYLSSGVLSASIAVPAVAIFWKRANTPGVMIGSILGAVSTVAMYLWEYKAIADNYTEVLPAWLVNGYGYLYIGTGVVVAVISLIVVSLITSPFIRSAACRRG